MRRVAYSYVTLCNFWLTIWWMRILEKVTADSAIFLLVSSNLSSFFLQLLKIQFYVASKVSPTWLTLVFAKALADSTIFLSVSSYLSSFFCLSKIRLYIASRVSSGIAEKTRPFLSFNKIHAWRICRRFWYSGKVAGKWDN